MQSHKPEPRVYTSNEVATACGVTLRQLQWWDERKVVSPRQDEHKRGYTPAEVVEISIIAELRRKGLSLQSIRRIMRVVRKDLGKYLSAARDDTRELYLITDEYAAWLEYGPSRTIVRLKSAQHPMILVCITDHLCWLESAA